MATIKLVIGCPRACSFHPDTIGPGAAAALLAIRENGAGQNIFARRAKEILGHPVPLSSVSRHLRHYKEAEDPNAGPPDPSKKLADLEILDLVIQRGAANSGNWKPTIKDTIEAMKLKLQMTGNSAFDDLIALFDGTEATEALDEAEEAIRGADEAAQALEGGSDGEEPLGEPVF